MSGGVLPDLRYSNALRDEGLWQQIVHDGLLQHNGMVAFGSELSKSDIDAIHAYVIRRAHEQLAEDGAAQKPRAVTER